MKPRTRIILGIVFVVGMMLCGFVAGSFVGGRFFLPPGAGLAGAAIVLGYGVIGAGLAAVLGAALAYLLPPKWFLGVALPVTLVGVILLVALTNILLKSEAQQQASLEEAYERLNAFRVTLVHVSGDTPFKRMEADWGARRYTVTANDARTCTAALSGKEAVALLSALREVEGVVLNDAHPCAGTLGEVERELDWFIPEAQPPNSEGKHAITAACAAEHPALLKPFEAAAEIFRNGDHPKDCS